MSTVQAFADIEFPDDATKDGIVSMCGDIHKGNSQFFSTFGSLFVLLLVLTANLFKREQLLTADRSLSTGNQAPLQIF